MALQDRIGLGIYPANARAAIDTVVRADAAGVTTAWTVMLPLGVDTLTLYAAAAVRTDRIKLGTAIVPSFTRHPLGMVTQARVLDELAPGRLRLGIGTGNIWSGEHVYGVAVDRPLSRLREYVTIVRAALRDGRVSFAGDHFHVEAEFPGPIDAPVLISTIGEKSFELAGEATDGAITWNAPSAYVDGVGRPAIARGAERADRAAPPIIQHVLVSPRTDRDAVRRAAHGQLAPSAGSEHYRRLWDAAGFPVNPDGSVPDALVDALVVSGDDAEITDALHRRLAAHNGELLLNLVDSDDQRADEDALFRIVGRL